MIIHILSSSPNATRFVEFMQKYFDLKLHYFCYVRPDICKFGLNDFSFVEHINTEEKEKELLKKLQNARKIILHGLWRKEVINLLYKNPNLLEKCYWVLWGGDFCLGKHSYSKEHNEVISKVGNFIGFLDDFKYCQKEYGVSGKIFSVESFYPSNLFCEDFCYSNNNITKILLGNSGDPLNNHLEILESLIPFKSQKLEIICPLSYSASEQYLKEVTQKGKELFKDSFKPLLEFMPLNEYLEILKSIDIAIFAHKNQQAFGNIVKLAGMGKKIYMRKTSIWDSLNSHGIRLFCFDNGISLEKIDKKDALKNYELIKEFYGLKSVLSAYEKLFK